MRNKMKKRKEQEERKKTKLYNNHPLKGRREETDRFLQGSINRKLQNYD
jgi:hypothetical protein